MADVSAKQKAGQDAGQGPRQGVGEQMAKIMLETYRRELADKIADPERLKRAYGSRFLDKALSERLRAVCKTACQTLNGDFAFINVIGADELVFAAIYGDYEGGAVQTDQSYCQHTIMDGGKPFAVEDGRLEQLVCDLQVVTEGGLYSYLGVPLIDPGGYVVGTLCVLGTQARQWRASDTFVLTSLASAAYDIAYPGVKRRGGRRAIKSVSVRSPSPTEVAERYGACRCVSIWKRPTLPNKCGYPHASHETSSLGEHVAPSARTRSKTAQKAPATSPTPDGTPESTPESTQEALEGGEVVSIEEFTPEMAESFLDANRGNRPINMAQVENLARLMAEGKWRFNGDAIRIAKDGTLLDGQHRCAAVARSRVTLPQQLIVRGLQNESQATMDQGRKRTAADVLGMQGGFSNGNQMQAIARMVNDWKNGKRSISELSSGGRLVLTPDEILEWARRDENLHKAALVSVRAGMRQLVLSKAAGTLWFLCNEVDSDKAAEFFELLESGAGLNKGNPILTCRNYWQNLRVGTRVPVGKYLAAGVRAWNRWMVGESLTMISQRLDLEIPDVYVPPGTIDTVNRWEGAGTTSTTPLSLVAGAASGAAARAATPKRTLGGEGSLFSER